VTLRLFFLMVVRGATYGAIVPFASVLAIRAGLPVALVGPLAAAGAVLTLLSAQAWGRYGDRLGRRRVVVAAFLLGAPAAAGQAAGVLPVFLAAYLLWAVAASAYVPLIDSLSLARLGGSRSRFARVRAGATTGFIISAVSVGAVVTFTAVGWRAPGVAAAVLAITAAAAVALRLGTELRTGTGLAAGASGGLWSDVRTEVRRQATFLGGLVLVFAGANAPAIFTGPRVAELGGSGWEIGLATAASAMAEIPAYLLLPIILVRLGGRRLFLVGGVLLGVSGLLSAVAPTPTLVIVARLFFGAGFAWVIVPSLGAIAGAAAPTRQAAATALHFATSAAGSLVVAVAGLPLVGLTGSVSLVLAVAAIGAPIGALVAAQAWPLRGMRTGRA
jgi:DHA1 family bicyclomycin/chloramphenicol resistance-like MFS transporter